VSKRSCIFCDAPGPLTNEHVIPDWLQRYIGGSETSTVRGAHLSSIGTLLSERKGSGNTHKLGTVCGTCNNGWMSDLETAFSQLLPRLEADMSPKRFSVAERRIIALWIVKTGIIVHYSSNYRIILPASVRARSGKTRLYPLASRYLVARYLQKKPSDGANRMLAPPLSSAQMLKITTGVKTHLCLRFQSGIFSSVLAGME
jgi:hypothetical protein